jgi:hypothetical protein
VPIIIDPKEIVIGPAFVYYREVGVNTPWSDAGVTLDDAVMRIQLEMFRPDNLTGVPGPVKGLDVVRRCNAEIEFTLAQWAGAKFGLAIPGARITAPAGTTVGGGVNTTLSGAVSVGATTVPLTATTNLAVGDVIKVGTGTTVEYRTVTAIASLNVSFRDPLLFAHAAAEAVVETVDDMRTLIEAPNVRRLADSAYHEWALVAESGKSGVHELRLPIGLSQTDTAEVTVGDDSVSGIRVNISARYDGSALGTSPFKLYAPA